MTKGSDDLRHFAPAADLSGRRDAPQRQDADVFRIQHPRGAEACRPGGRLGADSGSQGPEACHARHAPGDGAGNGDGRRGHRPGRLFRDFAPHHARGPGLLRRRHPALLRGQHSGRRAPHLDPRAYERDASLHHPACRQGLAARRTGESRAGAGAEHHRRQGGLQTRGRRLGAALRTVGAVTCRDGNPQAL